MCAYGWMATLSLLTTTYSTTARVQTLREDSRRHVVSQHYIAVLDEFESARASLAHESPKAGTAAAHSATAVRPQIGLPVTNALFMRQDPRTAASYHSAISTGSRSPIVVVMGRR